jgi:hypothetical protein
LTAVSDIAVAWPLAPPLVTSHPMLRPATTISTEPTTPPVTNSFTFELFIERAPVLKLYKFLFDSIKYAQSIT